MFLLGFRCAVRGLQELHDNGYYCPKLSAKFIAVVKQHDSVSAKLWYFCPLLGITAYLK